MRKKMIILLQLMIAIILVATSVYATVNATLELKVSESNVKKGEELMITLSLKNVDSEKKVRSVSGYINYDENIIEKITVDNIVKESDNTVKIGDETLTVEDLTNKSVDDMPDTSAYIGFNGSPTSDNDARIVIDFNNGITTDIDLISIKFKVKSDATVGEVENAIEYKMFVITAGSETSQEISKDVTLTVVNIENNNQDNNGSNEEDKKDDENETGSEGAGQTQDKNETKNEQAENTQNKTNTTNNASTNNIVNNTNANKNNTNVIDGTVAGTKLPATGARAIIIPAIILILCAYISYNQYMKYKKI